VPPRAPSRTSIRSILRWSLVLVVVVPFLPLAFLSVRNFRHDLARAEAELQGTNQQVARLSAEYLDAFVAGLPGQAALGAHAPDGLPPPSAFVAWERVSAHGVVTASHVAPGRVGRDAGFGAFLATLQPGPRPAVSSIVARWIEGWPPTALLSPPTAGPQRADAPGAEQPAGTLVAVVRTEALHDLVHGHVRFGQPDEHHVYAVDRDGRVAFHCLPEVVGRGATRTPSPPIELFLAGGEGPIRYVSVDTGRARLGHVARLRGLDWGVVASADVDAHLLGLRARYLMLLWSIAFGFVAAVAMFFWTARRLVGPVREIRQALQDEARRALDPLPVKAEATRLAEYAALVRAFDELAARLAATERELVQTEKTALLGQLASGIAHEIGTPLNVMSGYAQVLKRRLADDAEACAVLDRIVKQTARLTELVHRILDFARPNPEQPEPVDLGEVVRQALGLVGSLTKGVMVEVNHNPRTPPVLGHARLLESVLLNLVVNAVHACEERRDDGRVWIATGVRTAAGAAPRWVYCQVRDNGVGIPPEHRDKIFQPFFTTKAEGQGTGLGLAIVERIVRQHGGEVEVESTPGQGTTFTVLLRGAPSPAGAGAAPAPPAPAG
jgi:signal transduction histidine kinase